MSKKRTNPRHLAFCLVFPDKKHLARGHCSECRLRRVLRIAAWILAIDVALMLAYGLILLCTENRDSGILMLIIGPIAAWIPLEFFSNLRFRERIDELEVRAFHFEQNFEAIFEAKWNSEKERLMVETWSLFERATREREEAEEGARYARVYPLPDASVRFRKRRRHRRFGA